MKKLVQNSALNSLANSILGILIFTEHNFFVLLVILFFGILNRKICLSQEKIEKIQPFSHRVVLSPEIKIPYQKKAKLSNFPEITAKSILVADLNTRRILYQKNSSMVLAPASTTKLMTALVSLDIYSLSDFLLAPSKCLTVFGGNLNPLPQEKFLVSDLLNALLISSSNDSACILANNAVSEEKFVQLMNQKATKIGMVDTFFTNPMGFDSSDYSHKSTAWDLYLLGLESRSNPLLRNIYSKTEHTFISGLKPRTVFSTNHLLSWLDGTVGMKTGTTNQAGEVFIYEYEKGEQNIMIILMKSRDRFWEVEKIMSWINQNYYWN